MIRELRGSVKVTLSFPATKKIETFNVASMDADVVEVSPYERVSDLSFSFTVTAVEGSDSVTSVIAEAIEEGSDETRRWQCAFSTIDDRQDVYTKLHWDNKDEYVDPIGCVRVDYDRLTNVGGIF